MHELVQSAMNVANQGDKNKAIEFIQQALKENPKDLDAWLVFANLVDESTRKRQVLNRILSLDPTNKTARDMMLELDRDELNALRSQKMPVPVSNSHPHSISAAPEQKITPQPQRLPKANNQNPLILSYSAFRTIPLYFVTIMFCCFGSLVVSQNFINSLPFFVLALVGGLSALSFSFKAEVSEAGIRTSTLLSRSEITWDSIASLKSNSIGRKLELTSNTGNVVKISTQTKNYLAFIDILRQRRPDLFVGVSSTGPREVITSSSDKAFAQKSSSNSSSAPAFSDVKIFRKSFFRQYGMSFLMFGLSLLFIYTGFTEPEHRIGSILAFVFCGLIMIFPFFQVNVVRLEPNQLTVETFFEEKGFTADQIKEIKMQAIRGRRGRVTNIVNIIPAEGKNYPMGGFSDGDEIIYGTLMNWWNTYKNK